MPPAGGEPAYSAEMRRFGGEKWQQCPEELADMGREGLSSLEGGRTGGSLVRISSGRASESSSTLPPFTIVSPRVVYVDSPFLRGNS